MTKLTHLHVEDFKRIQILDIALRDHTTEISGPNGSGKTSTIDAMETLLLGKDAAPPVPIRKGCEQSIIRGKLGELILERKFKRVGGTEYTTSLTLRSPDGARYPQPQTYLDDLIGTHMLDPLEFIRAKPEQQFDFLRRFVPDVNFEEIERANKGDETDRRDINRWAKEQRAAGEVIDIPRGTPDEPVDESALTDEMQRAGEQNAEIERRKGNRQKAADKIAQLRAEHDRGKAECDRLLLEIQRIRDVALKANAEADVLQEKLDNAEALPEPIDVSQVRAKLDAARKTNQAVTLRKKRTEHLAAAEKYERQSEELTARIAARNTSKAEAIAKANIPVPGIGFGDRCVLLNDLPFTQASTAEQLATVFALIVALNPKVRLAWIRDASLLDDDMRKTVEQLAEKYDIQVLLETIRPGSANAIVLEDGNVKDTRGELSAAQGSLV